MEVPNNNTSNQFQAYQVDRITLNSTVNPEIVVYSMIGATQGTIQLDITRVNADFSRDIQKQNVTYGCSASDFQWALNRFDGFSSFVISVTRNIYDGSNNTLPNTTGALRVDYVVEIYKLRDTKYQAERFGTTFFNGYDGSFS